MKEFFILPRALPEWRLIETGIEREFQDRYKDRKGRKKKKFNEHGGYDDIETARKNPLEDMDNESWQKLVDLFTTPQFMARSKANAANRAKQKYPSLHGSTSYVSARFKKVNKNI